MSATWRDVATCALQAAGLRVSWLSIAIRTTLTEAPPEALLDRLRRQEPTMDDRDRVHGPGAFLRRPAILATVAGLTLALVLGGLAWNATRPTDDGSANASHPPGTTVSPDPP